MKSTTIQKEKEIGKRLHKAYQNEVTNALSSGKQTRTLKDFMSDEKSWSNILNKVNFDNEPNKYQLSNMAKIRIASIVRSIQISNHI